MNLIKDIKEGKFLEYPMHSMLIHYPKMFVSNHYGGDLILREGIGTINKREELQNSKVIQR